jgi:HAD superfamily hydrolase (TIGR01509 family)
MMVNVTSANAAPPRAVVFDLDGLMFNTEDLYDQTGSEVLRRRGKEFTNELRQQMMGRPGRDALRFMIEMHALDDTVEQLLAESDVVFNALLDSRLAPMPGLLELLARLEAAERPKAVATSSRRQVVHRMLNQFDFLPRFEFILTSEDVTHGKPHPEVFLTAADRFGVEPHEILVLEDSENGCRAAVASGAVTVAVPSEHSRHHQFEGAALVAENLHDPRIYELLGLAARRQK